MRVVFCLGSAATPSKPIAQYDMDCIPRVDETVNFVDMDGEKIHATVKWVVWDISEGWQLVKVIVRRG